MPRWDSALLSDATEDDSWDLISVMGTQDACDVTLILHARSQTAFSGSEISDQLLPQLAIPASTNASADRAGG